MNNAVSLQHRVGALDAVDMESRRWVKIEKSIDITSSLPSKADSTYPNTFLEFGSTQEGKCFVLSSGPHADPARAYFAAMFAYVGKDVAEMARDELLRDWAKSRNLPVENLARIILMHAPR